MSLDDIAPSAEPLELENYILSLPQNEENHEDHTDLNYYSSIVSFSNFFILQYYIDGKSASKEKASSSIICGSKQKKMWSL